MTLYEFLKANGNDFDTYDDVFDATVTVSINLDDPEDDYDIFCIELVKKIEVKEITIDRNPVCGWTDYIKRNLGVFKKFTQDHWYGDYSDEDDLIYEWIEELHGLLAGYGIDDKYSYYKERLVDACN